MAARLRVNPIACEAHGLCVELLPELIRLDDWGYPIIDDAIVPDDLIDLHSLNLQPHQPRAGGCVVDRVAGEVPQRLREPVWISSQRPLRYLTDLEAAFRRQAGAVP